MILIVFCLLTISEGETMMKGLLLRMPENLLKWTREKAARETIKRGEQVSMNTVILELIRREMVADQKKEG
jgi:hypothetical protein